MNDEFSHKFEDAQPEKILQVLNQSFDTPDDVDRHKTSCAIFNVHMRGGASIMDHVLYMIEQIECLSKFKFFLHKQLGKDVIIKSLPKSYLPFLSHYRMTKPTVNYHGLLGLLQIFEKDHQLHKEPVNVVGGSSSGHCPFKKGKKKKNKKIQRVGVPKPIQTKKSKADQSQMKYFYCKKLDH